MLKNFLCRLPLSLKILLGNMKTYTNSEKVQAIKKIEDSFSHEYINLNSKEYKKNLAKFLKACAYTTEETRDYIEFLYHDKVELVHAGMFDLNKPSIICFEKNDANKLSTFFNHHDKVGEFNYIFIDNCSSDESRDIIIKKNGTVYSSFGTFSTNRKLAWINKVYSTLPNGMWTIMLDVDELLVYDGYESFSFNSILRGFEQRGIKSIGAIMIDMFSNEPVAKDKYLEKYIYFENRFHEEKSFYFNSVYGGIREREFKFGMNRIFLIKKHPVLQKEVGTMLIHCHYNYPFVRNLKSQIYLGLLHYKLFDSELDKYKKIVSEGSYESGSIEYKSYLSILNSKTYEQIFEVRNKTEKFEGTKSLKKITCLLDVGENCRE